MSPFLADLPLNYLRAEAPWKAADFDALAGFHADPAAEVAALVAAGESPRLEFKSTARWDVKQGTPSKVMEKVIVKTVAAFLNSAEGGTLLIGVADDGTALGAGRRFADVRAPNRSLDWYETS